MKKLLLLTLALSLFYGCSKDDDPKPTTYTFKYELTGDSDLVTVDFTFFEYNEKDERVGFNTLKNVKYGQSKTFEANGNTQKVKAYLTMSGGSTERTRWIQQVYYLNIESNTDIIINGSTLIGALEP